MKPIEYIFIFGIIGAVCTGLVVVFTLLHNKSSSEKSTNTLENTKQIIEENKDLKEIVKEQSNKIDELRRENTELSLKIHDESLKIYNNLTSGGHKPILQVEATIPVIDQSGKTPPYFMIQFIIRNYSKYSFRNLRIRILDFTGKEMVKHGIKQSINGMQMSSGVLNPDQEYESFDIQPIFELGALSPNAQKLIYRTTYSPEIISMDAHYNVEINWDNGHLMHFIRLKTENEKMVKGHWEGTFNGKSISENDAFMFLGQ